MATGDPPPRHGPAFDDAGLAASGERARAVWTAESAAERDRLLRLPAAARLAALDDDAVRTLLTTGHRAEVRASLAPAPGESHHRREEAMATWEVERRRLSTLLALRPIAAVGCAVAAALPFALAAWRWGWSPWDGLGAFLAPGWPLAGVALAAVAAGVMARLLARAGTLEELAWPVVGSGVAGVLGLALATY